MVRSEDSAHRRLETQNRTPHPPYSLLFLALVTRLAPSLYSAKIFFIPTLSFDPKVSQQVLSAHVLWGPLAPWFPNLRRDCVWANELWQEGGSDAARPRASGTGWDQGSLSRGRSKRLFHLGLAALVKRCSKQSCPSLWEQYLPLPAVCSLPSPWFLHETGELRIVPKVQSSVNSLRPKQAEGTVHLEAVSDGANQYQRFPNILQLQIHICFTSPSFYYY